MKASTPVYQEFQKNVQHNSAASLSLKHDVDELFTKITRICDNVRDKFDVASDVLGPLVRMHTARININ